MGFVKDLDKIAKSVTAGLRKDLGKYQKEANKALETFRKTMNELETVNEKIDKRVELADTQISEIDALKQELLANKASNEKVRNKIAEFLA